MKRNFTISCAIFFLSILLAACAFQNSSTPEPTPDANSPITRIRIGVNTDLPPYAIFDAEKQEVVGFDIDLIKAIAKRSEIYVEFISINAGYNHLLALAGQCQLDGAMSAIQLTDELKKQMDFSDPYFTTRQVLVVKKGNIKITGLDTLSGMTVGTQANSLSAVELQKMKGIQPKYYESYFLAFQDLINGNIDAAVADHPRAWNYVKVKPNNIKIVGDEFGSVSYAISFCKSKPEVLGKINTALANMKQDGSLEKLVKEWGLTNYEQ